MRVAILWLIILVGISGCSSSQAVDEPLLKNLEFSNPEFTPLDNGFYTFRVQEKNLPPEGKYIYSLKQGDYESEGEAILKDGFIYASDVVISRPAGVFEYTFSTKEPMDRTIFDLYMNSEYIQRSSEASINYSGSYDTGKPTNKPKQQTKR
ncbi:hypothetical protein [Paenibacillus sp. P22]|uniref:hypothetical protein n=1 Tax=Paenibacillus sp. P22 TaxID=483908 RepID=UPI0012ECEC37|nr:hypothetical protein [Paenibacillus sp. P22]